MLPPSSSRVWYTSSGLRKTSGTASRAGAGRRISGLASGAGALSAEGRGAAAWVKDQRGALRAGIGDSASPRSAPAANLTAGRAAASTGGRSSSSAPRAA